MNFKKSTLLDFKNILPTLFSKVFGLVLSYLVIFFITNKYGAEVYGKYSITITIGQLVSIIFTLGFPNLIVKLLNDKNHFTNKLKTNFLNKIFITTFIVGAIFSILFYSFSNFISEQLFKDTDYNSYLKIISFFFLPIMYHDIFIGYFKGIKNLKKHNLFIFILPPLLFFVSYFLLSFFVKDSFIVVLSYGVAFTCILFFELYFFSKIKIDKYLKKIKTSFLIRESFPMMYSSLMLYLLGWTDIFMIEGIKTTKEVGIYSAAFKTASVALLVITAINVIISPKVASLYNKSDFKNLHKTILSYTRIITLLTLPIFLFLFIFSKDILSYFGEDFIDGNIALKIIVVGVFINAISGNVDQILNMTGYQKILGRIVLTGFVLNVILNLLLIPNYGINGAAVASLLTTAFINLSSIYVVKKKLGFYTFK